MVDLVPEELWTRVCNTVQGAVTDIIPKKKKCKKAKQPFEEPLQIAKERREAKDKGERKRYTQLYAEFQRIKRCLLLGKKAMTKLYSILKSGDITLPSKVCTIKVILFLVVMNGCGILTIKKAECQRIDAFELWCLNSWEIKPVHPKENQLCIFIGRTDAKAEALILWPPNMKRQLIGKDPVVGED